MANTEITINNVILIRDGFITTVLRSTGGLFPPEKKENRKTKN